MIRSRSDGRVRQDHEQPIDAETETSGRRHAVLERAEEVLVERMRLLDARRLQLLLELELRALLERVGELGERGDELDAADDEVEVLRQARVGSVRPRERRDLAREVADERRLDDRLLDEVSNSSTTILPGPHASSTGTPCRSAIAGGRSVRA